jgi:serine/threonine protein kinase
MEIIKIPFLQEKNSNDKSTSTDNDSSTSAKEICLRTIAGQMKSQGVSRPLSQMVLEQLNGYPEDLFTQESFSFYFRKNTCLSLFFGPERIVICKLKGQEEIEVIPSKQIKPLRSAGGQILEGSVGLPLKLHRAKGKDPVILKVPKESDQKRPEYRIELDTRSKKLAEEIKDLEAVHSQGKIEGVQEPILASSTKPDDQIGFIMPYYSEGDLFSFIIERTTTNGNLSLNDAIHIIVRLVRANRELQERDCFNLDGKAENIFGKKESGSTLPAFDVCDLSLCKTDKQSINERKKEHPPRIFPYTPCLVPKDNYDQMQKIELLYRDVEENSIEYQLLVHKEKEALEKLVLSNLGVTAYSIFYGVRLPYQLQVDGFPRYSTLKILPSQKVPEDIRQHLERMINPLSRLTLDQSLDFWNRKAGQINVGEIKLENAA